MVSDMYIDRILFPHRSSFNLAEDVFFPEENNNWYLNSFNKEATHYQDVINNIPCLILLGESGTGKTTYLKYNYEQCQKTKIWVDSRRLANETAICNILFNDDFKTKYQDNDEIYFQYTIILIQ